MIIHLEAHWDDAILERFALIIAQHSLHFALQLNWILQGAIEDYQPEMPNGDVNANFNPLYYTRCIKLLGNIERCVVYGTPRKHELQRLYEKGQITKSEYEIMEQADRRFNAEQLTNTQKQLLKAGTFGGDLLYKRLVRTSRCSRKMWKTRYFAVSERMLYCYNVHPSQGGRLIRAMPLEGAVIMETPESDAKYRYMFEVHNLNYFFRMRAANNDERSKWIQALSEERDSHTLYPYQLGSRVNSKDKDDDGEEKKDESNGGEEKNFAKGQSQSQLIKDLTPAQKARYDFFKNEREFNRRLTGIAEDLRHHEREVRKTLAPQLVSEYRIPPCVYVPLCNSSDIWRRVYASIASNTKVFNTNERCPVIMYFLTRRGERMNHHRGGMKDINLDVAEYMHLQYEVPDAAMAPIEEEENEGVSLGCFEVVEEGGREHIVQNVSSESLLKKSSSHSAVPLWDDEEHNKLGSGSQDVVVDLETSKDEKAVEMQIKESTSFEKGTKANPQLRNFVKENFVRIPSKIKARLPMRQKGRNMMSQLPVRDVPILENRAGEDDDENRSVLSDGQVGSIMLGDGEMLRQTENDGIDDESLKRATAYICGGENWAQKSERLLLEALDAKVIDNEASTEISAVMVKSNDDLRQEVFVMQMIHFYKSVFAKASLPIWLKTYRILSTSKDTGLIEYLIDSTSIDGLKKNDKYPQEGGLRQYFEDMYGPPESKSFKAAQRNFMLSLVGYSLVSYLLGLKDRHNGNIMIDVRGRMIHIDFGFAMGMAPGHEFSFERSPFKMTQEYVDVMGGFDSECYREFKRLFVAGFEAARANSQIAIGLVEIMMYKSNYPCFSGTRYGGDRALISFQDRLMLRTPDKDVRKKALALIDEAVNSYGTWVYDRFQLYSNGYAM